MWLFEVPDNKWAGPATDGQTGLRSDQQVFQCFPTFPNIPSVLPSIAPCLWLCAVAWSAFLNLLSSHLTAIFLTPVKTRAPNDKLNLNSELKTDFKGERGNSGMTQWHSWLGLARGTCHILMWILSRMRCFPRVPPSLCLSPRLLFVCATVTSHTRCPSAARRSQSRSGSDLIKWN